jgi:hypothetical protein
LARNGAASDFSSNKKNPLKEIIAAGKKFIGAKASTQKVPRRKEWRNLL